MNSRPWVQRVDHLFRRSRPITDSSDGTLEYEYACRVVDLAASVGQVAIGSGMSAADTRAAVLRVAATYGVRVHVDVTYFSVLVSCTVDKGFHQVTRLRTANLVYGDFSVLARVERFVDRIATGEVSLTDALGKARVLEAERTYYRPWVQAAASALMGFVMGIFLGGNVWEACFAALATLLTALAVDATSRRSLPYFFVHMISAAIPTAVALLLMLLRTHGAAALWQVSPSLVVASGVVTMLAGMSVVTAAQDALDGYFVIANARILDLLMRTGGLTLGVVVTLWIGLKLGVPAYLAPAAPYPVHLVVLLLCSGAFSVLFAVTMSLGPRAALVCGLLGVLAWSTYAVAMPVIGEHPAAATVAAFAVGLASQPGSSWWRVPSAALITTGIAPLMPGLLLYRGLYGLVVPDAPTTAPAGSLVATAAFTGLGLALGSSAGASLGRGLRRHAEIVVRHVPPGFRRTRELP